MNITLSRSSLLGALKHILQATDTSGTLPILTHVLLTLDGDGLTLVGSDLGMAATSRILLTDDERSSDGALCAPARKLYDIVRLLPEDAEIDMATTTGGTLKLTSGRSRFRLNTLPAESFPAFDAADVVTRTTLPAPQLLRAIDTATGAVALKDVRLYLNGLLVHVDADGLSTTGSDGHRLHRYRTPITALDGEPGTSAIVPRGCALEMAKMLRGTDDTATLTIGYRSVSLTLGGDELASKTIEGLYPDVTRIIPKKIATHCQCSRPSLTQSILRTATVANQHRGVRISFEPGQILIESGSATEEEASDAIEGTIDGEPKAIGINADYLITAIGYVIADQIEIDVADSGALLITDPNDAGYSAVVMPMRM